MDRRGINGTADLSAALPPDSPEGIFFRLVQATAGATGQQFFDVFVAAVAEVFRVREVVLAQIASDDRLHVLACAAGTFEVGSQLDPTRTPCGDVRATGEPLHVRSGARELYARCQPASDSYLGIPVRGADGALIAVLSMHDDVPIERDPALFVLSSFAPRAAGEIHRAREDVRVRERTESILRHQSALIALARLRVTDPTTALREILERAARTLSAARVSFWSMADGGASIVCEALFSLATGAFDRGARLAAARYPRYFAALRSREPIVAVDARSDPRTSEFNVGYFDVHDIHSMLDVPVWREGELVGVLCHEQVGALRQWTIEEEEFARAVAHSISLSLEAGARSRAEERFRLVASATDDVLYEWDFATDNITWSNAIGTALGYPHAVAEGTTAGWWLDRIHVADRERIESSVQKAIDGDAIAWTGEYRFLRGDGGVAFVTDRGFFIRDAAGVAVRMIGSVQDVTTRKMLEARLATADRMASMGTLAAGVAHEINNPLAYVMTNIDFALDELRPAAGNEVVVQALDEALHGATRVMHIVADLKTLSRPNDAPSRAIDVEVVLESSINMAWNEIRHRARLTRVFAHPPPIVATEAQLGQVLLNLLVNAAHAIPAGSAETQEITVTTGTDSAGMVFIEVRDTGAGIPAAVLDRIFDPFFTTKAVGEGTGLGLAICHSVVSALSGEISVQSQVSVGSTFRVAFPRAPMTEQPALVSANRVANAPRLRALVIDDDAYVATAIRRALARGYEVDVTTRAHDGIAALTRGAHYDVIICDLMMPDMTGMQVHEELLRLAPGAAARMVFLTGGAFTEAARAFVETVSQPVVDKPFTRETLERAIRLVTDPAKS